MLNNDLIPSRTALLELHEEEDAIEEAYDFLDEKRLMLAAELIRQVRTYRSTLIEFDSNSRQARHALERTLFRHGLRGSKVYPAADLTQAYLQTTERNYVGVLLQQSEFIFPADHHIRAACNPSPEADECTSLFQRLLLDSAKLAAISGNIQRLLSEYKRTQRRARALENVVIPEIKRDVHTMTAQLEELDQEDLVRVHLRL